MHSRVATRNLLMLLDEDGTDVVCIQEPYVIHNKITGIPRKYKIYTIGEGRHRKSIVVTNNPIDSLLIRLLLEEDTVVLEVVRYKAKNIVASMYFDINRQTEGDLNKIEANITARKSSWSSLGYLQ